MGFGGAMTDRFLTNQGVRLITVILYKQCN